MADHTKPEGQKSHHPNQNNPASRMSEDDKARLEREQREQAERDRQAAQNPAKPDQNPDKVTRSGASNTLTLSDDDLSLARKQAGQHTEAAAQFRSKHTRAEMSDPEVGEPRTVPQVNEFDMSAAFTKAAVKKAREAGYAGISNLRKENGVWVFEGTHAPAA